jgi:methylthioribose-1-phosphate isomerase
VAAAELAGARPTAVNLGWAARRVLAAHADGRALAEAHAIAAEEAEASARMGAHGLTLVPENARVLTHCNAGSLAAGGEGTALAVVVAAHRAGRLKHLWVDETRPLLQGARLTAYEARRHGIPYAVLPDNAAGSLFAAGEVDMVVVGADRIARDHSVANKVGTYPLAVLAHHHGVPFVVVAPTSTVDPDARTGDDIPIEQRAAEEVTSIAGHPVAPEGSAAYNPAFDVTPGDLVTAIVTERGVITRANGGNLGLPGGPED